MSRSALAFLFCLMVPFVAFSQADDRGDFKAFSAELQAYRDTLSAKAIKF